MIQTKAKNKTRKVAFKLCVTDELPENILSTYIYDAIRRKFSLNGATIQKGKTNDDFSTDKTTIIISKFITPNPTQFRNTIKRLKR